MRFVAITVYLLVGAIPAAALVTGTPGKIVWDPNFSLADDFEDSNWDNRYEIVSVQGAVSIIEAEGRLLIETTAENHLESLESSAQLVFNRTVNPGGDFYSSVELTVSSQSTGNAEAGFFVLTDPENRGIGGIELSLLVGQRLTFSPDGQPKAEYYLSTSVGNSEQEFIESPILPDQPYTLGVDYRAFDGALTLSLP